MLEFDMERVVCLFSLFSDLEGESLQRWRSFCHTAARSLSGKVREGVGEEAMEELCAAAAGLAYSSYLALRQGSRQSDELRVGDISLSASASSGGSIDADGLRDYFLAGVAHLLEPEYAALLAVGEPR